MASRAEVWGSSNVVRRRLDRLTWVTTASVQAITQSCSSGRRPKPRSFYFNGGGGTPESLRALVVDLMISGKALSLNEPACKPAAAGSLSLMPGRDFRAAMDSEVRPRAVGAGLAVIVATLGKSRGRFGVGEDKGGGPCSPDFVRTAAKADEVRFSSDKSGHVKIVTETVISYDDSDTLLANSRRCCRRNGRGTKMIQGD